MNETYLFLMQSARKLILRTNASTISSCQNQERDGTIITVWTAGWTNDIECNCENLNCVVVVVVVIVDFLPNFPFQRPIIVLPRTSTLAPTPTPTPTQATTTTLIEINVIKNEFIFFCSDKITVSPK